MANGLPNGKKNGNGRKNGNGKKPKQMLFDFGPTPEGVKANRTVRAVVASELRAKAGSEKFAAMRDALRFATEVHNAETAQRLKRLVADFRSKKGKPASKNVKEFISWLEWKKKESERAASNALRFADGTEQAEGYRNEAEFISRYISYLKIKGAH